MLEVHTNKIDGCENQRRMGRTRKDPSRELIRFSWLITQLEAAGIGQQEVAHRTGIKISYLNQIKSYEKYGKTGVGAETVRLAMDGLRLSPSYFFADYEGQQDFRLHLLSAMRDEKRVTAVETGLAQADRERAAQAIELAQLKARDVERSQRLEEIERRFRQLDGKKPGPAPHSSSRKARSS